MVCKNSESTIKESLNSYGLQKYKNKELIIVDGGSIDHTIEIIKKVNFHNYFKSIKDLGLYASINHAIKKCHGDIVGVLHSDDVYYDNFVLDKINQKFMEQNSIDYIYSNIVFINQSNKIRRKWVVGNLKPKDIFVGKFPPHTGIFVKKSTFKYTGMYNENYKISSDIEYMFKLIKTENLKGVYLPEFTIKMKLGGLSTRSLKNIFFSNLEGFKALKNLKVGYLNSIKIIVLKVIRKIIQINKL